jgi:hypothetical protein
MTDRIDEPNTETDEAPDTDEAPEHGADFGEWFDREFSGAETAADIEGADVLERATESVNDEPPIELGWVERAARRIVRRPIEWAGRPWPNERVLRCAVTVFSLVTTTWIMMNVVHLSPFPSRDLVFDNTTPTGGDFGAHVWGPAYLRDHLLPSLRFNGWSMDWYGGMPTYRFYMVLPALVILLIDIVLPYGVAMKVVSVMGLLTMPAACWAFGRLGKFRYPMPELFAFAGLAFVLDESFSIYGGNLKSTMAGEFSFSFALSLAVLGLGVLAAGLETGKYRVWASVLIAAACVSHGIVLIFVALAALVFCLVWIDRTRLTYALTVGVTSILLLAWWVGPFLLNHEYMTDMKYRGEPNSGSFDSWWDMFFPLTAPLDILITTLAVIGFLMSIIRRHLNGAALGVTAILLVAGVYLAKDSLPMIGLLWNPRLLPFLYLCRYLLMMIGAVEVLTLFWNAVGNRRAQESPGVWAESAIAGFASLVVLVVLGWMFQMLPFDGTKTVKADGADKLVYSWGPFTATSTNADAQGNGWSNYNFDGYEGRNEYYTEYHQVVTTMKRIGDDPSLGCGRANWENHPDNGQYGTTMALMLLPFWTDGCIGSMEGLFFEASGTTPYHFITTAAMSKQSSNPVREIRYVNNDAEIGVRHLQDLGVRYVMVRSPEAKAAAAAQADLSFIASSVPWDIYLVGGSDLVTPMTTRPVVVRGRDGDGRERNLELGTSWFQQPDEWAAMPADDGPDDWQRISVQVDLSRREGAPGDPSRRVDIVVPVEQIEPVELPAVAVSNVDIQQQSLSFDVDQVGVPVLVKVSYFPNWKAKGAEGPYRIGPNMMVVVPTSEHIELEYGRTSIDYFTMLMTVAGIALCFYWRKRGDVRHESGAPGGFAVHVEALAGGDHRIDSASADEGPVDEEYVDWSKPAELSR